jgi:hypothetical protein
MLLMEIDKRLQTHGQLPDYSTVGTIEHMIPQTLDERWKKYLGAEADDDYLPIVINTIGNLCLLSGPAKSAAGQDPFECKKEGYSPLTALARQINCFADRLDGFLARSAGGDAAGQVGHVDTECAVVGGFDD